MAKRATGANVALNGKIESEYGVAPGGNYIGLRAYSWGLSESQELLEEPLLGAGRDPLAPERGAIDVTGQTVVPVDQRLFGYWLVLLLGTPVSEDAIGARGFIDFRANPVAGTTITLDGVVWTFVAADPEGNETLIGATLAETLETLAEDLNASADADIAAATYSADATRLSIQHDTADTTGNAFTLATNVAGARVSGATLAGGGLYRHVWHTGAATLPSMSVETEHKDLDPGSERFYAQHGIMANTLQIQRQRSGSARAQIDLIAQSETRTTATIAGVPVQMAVDLFSQFQGVLRIDGTPVANVTAGNLSLSNNLDVVEALRDDGLIDGADPGQTSLGFSLTSRFSNNILKRKADAAETITIDYGFRDAASGAELLIQAHEVHLPKPARQINGPGGIEVTYEARGAQAVALSRAATVTLINDVASYA